MLTVLMELWFDRNFLYMNICRVKPLERYARDYLHDIFSQESVAGCVFALTSGEFILYATLAWPDIFSEYTH